MAFTSSATAVRANSNWSWEGQCEEGHGKAWTLLRPLGAFRRGSWEVTWEWGDREVGGSGGGTQQAGRRQERQLLLVSLGEGGSEGWGREEQSP